MPSLHTAYALIVGVSAVLLVRNRVLRALWVFYPALVVFSIVATANHFFLDAAGGAGVAAIATLAVIAARTRSRNWRLRWWRRRSRRSWCIGWPARRVGVADALRPSPSDRWRWPSSPTSSASG